MKREDEIEIEKKIKFEEKVRAYIKQDGRSQAAIARKLGYTPGALNKWFDYGMPFRVLKKFCELFRLDEGETVELFDLAGYVISLKFSSSSPQSSFLVGNLLDEAALNSSRVAYRGIIGLPPPADKTVQQRENAVGEVYSKLIQPDITTLVITGIAGVGKSTLAAQVYRYVEDLRKAKKTPYTDQTVWLRIDQAATMVDLMGTLFEILGKPLPNLNQLASQNQALMLFRALDTVGAPRLVILDQFENLLDWQTGQALPDRLGVGEWIDALNGQKCASRVLLTSRIWPQGTREYPPSYMQEYRVMGLEEFEGIELLRKRGVQATEAKLRKAVQLCDGHAFALTLLASLLDRHKLDLGALLIDTGLWTGKIASSILDSIYKQRLNESQRKLLMAFSVYREPVLPNAAHAILDSPSKLPYRQIEADLDALLVQRLLQAIGGGCYQLHSIVASYAEDHFAKDDEQANQPDRRTAHNKAALYYLQCATTSCPPREQRQRVTDVHDLIEACWHSCRAGRWQEAYNLIEREGIFVDLKLWGANTALLDLYLQLLPLDKWHSVDALTAAIYVELGWVYSDLGRKREALRCYEQALSIQREIGDQKGEGRTLNCMGMVYSVLGKKAEALRCYEQALSIQREIGDQKGEGGTLNSLGRVYGDIGEIEKALNSFEMALMRSKDTGDSQEEARALNNLGLVYRVQREYQAAFRCLEQALNKEKQVGDRMREGTTLNNIGLVYWDQGKVEDARKYFEQSLSIHREIGNRDWEATTLNNLGLIYMAGGHAKEAQTSFEQALAISRVVGNLGGEGMTLWNIAGFYFERYRYDTTLACVLRARKIFEQVKGPGREVTERWINTLRGKIGEEGLAALLAIVEPQYDELIEQALREGGEETS